MHRLRFTGSLTRQEFERRCGDRADHWYHSFYFANGFEQPGDYNIGADIGDYGFPSDLRGRRVLDVGAAFGWFAFYFEQPGANVTAVDVHGREEWDIFGQPPAIVQASATLTVFEQRLPFTRSLLTMRELLGSRIVFRHTRVYDLVPAIFGGQLFDLIFLGANLAHFRDPIRGVGRGAIGLSRGGHRLDPGQGLGGRGSSAMSASPCVDEDPNIWWIPNDSCLLRWFEGAGFVRPQVSGQVALRCDRPLPSSHDAGLADCLFIRHERCCIIQCDPAVLVDGPQASPRSRARSGHTWLD